MANMVKLALKENFNYNSKVGGGGGGGLAGASKRGDKVKRILSLLVPLRASSPGRSSGGTRKGRRACN